MKNFPLFSSRGVLWAILAITGIFFAKISLAQNTFPATGSAGIGTTTPNASSILEVKSTTQGVLISRMTKTQRDAIASPVQGLLIYQTNNTPGLYYYDAGWNAVTPKSANKSLSNLTAPTAVNVDLLPVTTNTLNLGSSTLRWKDVNLFNLKFSDGTTQTSAFTPYTNGTGISISGTAISLANSGVIAASYGSSSLIPVITVDATGRITTASTVSVSQTGLANVNLSNLSATSINQSLVPNSNIYFDLGSPSLAWKDVYANGAYYLDGAKILSGDGVVNTFVGFFSGSANTSGNYNTGSGGSALAFNTTGSQNSAHGAYALYFNTTGNHNTANGTWALYSNSTGGYNTADGWQTLYSNTTGNYNSAEGMLALYKNTTGDGNIASGPSALYFNTSGDYNIAHGISALYSNTEGSRNISIGALSQYNSTTGVDNIAEGNYALYSNVTGSTLTAIGNLADVNATALSNSSCFGNDALITASNQVRIGNNIVSSIGGYVNWSNISDGRFKKNINDDVKGLEFINKLQPVTYTLDIHGINSFLRTDIPLMKTPDGKTIEQPKEDEAGMIAKEKIVYSGFIAQDVEKAAMEVGYDFSGVDAPKNDKDAYGLRYAEFVVPLVKAVQELDENQKSEVGSRKSEVQKLKNEIADLKSQMASLQSSIENQKSSMTDGYAELKTQNTKTETLLGQNIPNPFNNSTLIPFRIPKDCYDASIMITNTSTSQVISVIPISCNENHVSIDAGVLASGTYSYTLYVNGKIVDTKSMVLQN